MRVRFAAVAGILSLLVFGTAAGAAEKDLPPSAEGATAEGAGAHGPTPYSLVRWDEDYTFLRDPAKRTDPWDPVKYIPFNDAGDVYASFGAQFRERYEFFNHPTFGADPHDRDGYNLQRLLLHLDLHLGPNLRVFLQSRSAFEEGREGGPRSNDVDQADFEQAFADLILPVGDASSLTLRGGRQTLLFGAQRLIGPSDFSNARKTFDGFRGTLASPNNSLDVFLVRPVQVEKYKFNSDDNANVFGGIYDTMRLPQLVPGGDAQLELYGLYLKRKNTAWPTETVRGYENRYTVGTRFDVKPKPFDLDVEGDYQFGDFAGGRINAFSLAIEGGYNLEKVELKPRAFLAFDIASGDRNRNDKGLQTFNQLYPSAHTFFGYIDVIGRQNIIDLHPGVELTLAEHTRWAQRMGLRAEFHEFWRESAVDAMYGTSGSPRGTGATGSPYIGSEIDLLLNWQIDRHLSSYIGYSHFFTGGYISATGPHEDIDFFYAALTYTF